uniref:Uncharacterized protein n=1 Tax=Romanomermis culicivorax TaxID=13658 RepID=A0A915HRY5_ROMCU
MVKGFKIGTNPTAYKTFGRS